MTDTWGQIIPCWRRSVPYRMLSRIPGLHPLDARAPRPVTQINVPKHCQVSLGSGWGWDSIAPGWGSLLQAKDTEKVLGFLTMVPTTYQRCGVWGEWWAWRLGQVAQACDSCGHHKVSHVATGSTSRMTHHLQTNPEDWVWAVEGIQDQCSKMVWLQISQRKINAQKGPQVPNSQAQQAKP